MSGGPVDEQRQIVDRDKAYDQGPQGQPPIRVYFYRDALSGRRSTRRWPDRTPADG